jgi:hypothetical protein
VTAARLLPWLLGVVLIAVPFVHRDPYHTTC